MHVFEEDLESVLEHTRDIWTDLRGERVFITGGTGFVGRWLVQSFIHANRRLGLGATALVLSRRPPPEEASAVAYTSQDPSGNFAFVIHAATDRGADRFHRDIALTERVLAFADSHGTKRLLFTSSGAIYGTQPPDLTHLSEAYAGAPQTTDVSSAYGQAKRVSEFRCAQAGAVIARLFAFAGPYLPLDQHYAVGNFIGNVLHSEPVHVKGDGTPYRSYLYAADLAIWLWTLLLRGSDGQAYNVGSPHALSIAELAEAVVRNTVPETLIVIEQTAPSATSPPRYIPSVEKAERELGLKVLIPLPEAIRRTYSWHLQRLHRS